jgi:hypothetical protein
VKTHYDLLGIAPGADADTIKKAFRREIARYHPDKVIHLGREFQEMAATRAAELTIAYKTLTDPAQRADYDAAMTEGRAPLQPEPPAPPAAAPTEAWRSMDPPDTPPRLEDIKTPPPLSGGGRNRFAAERADRDLIVRRAITGRVHAAVAAALGNLEVPVVRGFDMALVPVAKPRFLGAPPARVLVRVLDRVDAAAMTDAYAAAARTKIHAGKSPVVVLLFAADIAPQHELSRAYTAAARQPKVAGGPEDLTVVVIDKGDWSCRLPPDCSAAVRKLAGQICS